MVVASSIDEFDIPNPFTVKRTSEIMAMDPQEWLLDGFIYEDSIVVMFGGPGCGKSFLTFNWFAHFAVGQEWLGHRIRKQGLMIYTAAEGARGYQRRAMALEKQRGIDIEDLEENLMWITASVNLDSRAQVSAYIDAINTARGKRPLLGLCIDTLFQCAGGIDINKPGDASKLMDAIKHVKDQTQASFVVVVHHAGKDDARGAMGSMALKASCDLMYEVKKDEITNVLTVKSHKVKDDEAIEKTFVLRRIVFGDGPRDHSCVVVSADEEIDLIKKSFGQLPFNQQIVFDALGIQRLQYGEWKRICGLKGVKPRTFEVSVKALVEKGQVHKEEPDKNNSFYRQGPAIVQEQGITEKLPMVSIEAIQKYDELNHRASPEEAQRILEEMRKNRG